jgi:transposase-like protein
VPKKLPSPELDLPELIERFGSEDKCHAYLEALRWPNGLACPKCNAATISRIDTRRIFECSKCEYQFSVRVGTIFHDSKLPLWKWFLAVYVMVQSRKGVSANQLKRMLGVSYKTAWYLCHRIRAAMKDDGSPLLSGIVEVDETFIGGKRSGVGAGGYHRYMTPVVGAVERGGRVRFAVVKNRKAGTLQGFIRDNVSPDATEIMTDEFPSYNGIADENTKHSKVNHSKGEWVNGKIHTNTMEGVWSLLDRSIVGAYHKVSKKHLPAYLHEVAFRFNNRENPFLFRDTIIELIKAERVEYKALTA